MNMIRIFAALFLLVPGLAFGAQTSTPLFSGMLNAPLLLQTSNQVFSGYAMNNGNGKPIIKILCDNSASLPAGCDGGVMALYNGASAQSDPPRIELLGGANNSFFQQGQNLILGANGKTIIPDEQLVISTADSIAFMDTVGSPGTSDAGISRISAGRLGLGNGTPADITGSLSMGQLSIGANNNRAAVTLVSTTQFQGIDFYNTSHDVAKIYCSAATCDGGTLSLFNAGTAVITLAAAAPSSINTQMTFGSTVTVSGLTASLPVCTDGSKNLTSSCPTGNGSGAPQTITYQPGLLTAVNATIGVFKTFVKASTVDNLVGSAVTFSCVSNPTITLYECGTSSTCATPTTIGTVTVTAAGTRFTGTVSSPAIAAGDSIGWAITAGTCASIDIAGNAEVHAN